MTESTQPKLTPEELGKLQRLRASVLAFQNNIASLPAKEANNAHNEQFNQLRLEAKSLLKDRGFDKKVSGAITEDIMSDRLQRVIAPRLFSIITLGVVLVLLGLGVNSVILDDVVINTLGCLVSSAGFFLVVGAFGVFSLNRSRRRLSNYGNLYQYCEALLYQINHTLNMTLPDWQEHLAVAVPEIPSIVDLTLDSLQKQAEDWQEKLTALESQQVALGADTPLELTVNIDFVQRELDRVNQKIDSLRGHNMVLLPEGEAASPPLLSASPIEAGISVEAVEMASAHTLDMPPVAEEDPPATAADFEAAEFAEAEAVEESNADSFSAPASTAAEPTVEPNEEPPADAIENARANTLGMPVSKTDERPATDVDDSSRGAI